MATSIRMTDEEVSKRLNALPSSEIKKARRNLRQKGRKVQDLYQQFLESRSLDT